jgi:hypothetical protein
MTVKHKIIAASLIGLLLLTGFIVGRTTTSSATKAAEASPATFNHTDAQPANSKAQPANEVASNDQFYLSDFKTGYNDGYQAGAKGITGPATVETERAGYNEGYKEGYTDAYQAQADENAEPATKVTTAGATRERVVYRTVNQPVYRAPARKGRSKLKTALTIGAPAAIGAGIGAMFGGKKGAGIGALIGGGGGAIYELRKRRDR